MINISYSLNYHKTEVVRLERKIDSSTNRRWLLIWKGKLKKHEMMIKKLGGENRK